MADESKSETSTGTTTKPDAGTDAEDDPSLESTFDVEELGPCKVKVKVSVPVERIQSEIEKSFGELGSTLVYPGFRKGKVPRPILEKRFGDNIRDEVKDGLLHSSYEEAVEEKELHPLGKPKFDDVEFEVDKPLSFEVTVSVRPEFDTPEYKGIEVTEPPTDPSDEEVDKAIEGVLRNRAELVTVDEGVAKEGDYLIADISLHVGDDRVHFEEEASILVGGDVAFGIHDERIKDLTIEAKVDESKDLEVDIPESFAKEEHRGKKGKITVNAKEVKRIRLPELDDELAKALNFDSVDDFKKDVSDQLRTRKESEKNARIENDILGKIIESIELPLPDDVLEDEAKNVELRMRLRLMRMGLDEESIEKHLEEERVKSKEAVARSLREMFVLDKIGEAEKIFVTEDEVDRHLEARAPGYSMTFPQLKDEMREQGQLGPLRTEMRHEKVRAVLREKAKITPAVGGSAREKAPPKKAASDAKKKPAAKGGSKAKKKATGEAAKKKPGGGGSKKKS